ncbi:MAG TPA: polymer-forming cytoskeletal protein [Chitinophagales bacterium]|jgi:cytoskeletal protein CcmA (bactofilin family)|nr:polymer-forming cytoskeletal protein [Chitinophagales bacterium]
MFSKITSKSNLETMVANKINEGTLITGDLTAQTDIRIDGKVTGNIICTAKVVIGSSSLITGNIHCNDLTIEGKIRGNIEVNGTLYLRSTAQFEGDVKYKKLIVEEGASISGSLVNTTPITKPIQQTQQNGQTAPPQRQHAG